MPHPFDGMGQELNLGIADPVTGILTEKILVLITLRLENSGHAVVGFHPVMQSVYQFLGAEHNCKSFIKIVYPPILQHLRVLTPPLRASKAFCMLFDCVLKSMHFVGDCVRRCWCVYEWM